MLSLRRSPYCSFTIPHQAPTQTVTCSVFLYSVAMQEPVTQVTQADWVGSSAAATRCCVNAGWSRMMAPLEGNSDMLLAIERSGVVVVSALWIYVLSLDLVCASVLSFDLTDVMLGTMRAEGNN